MKHISLLIAALALVLLTGVASFAGVISEDVTYWFKVGDSVDTMMNPSTEWLQQNTANLLVKIQQTVYDQATTMAMLNRNNPDEGTNHPGFLYAYSVTNLNVGDLTDLADRGITSFRVEWPTPYYATVSRQTPFGWEVDTSVSSGPSWKWTPVDPGLLPGDTVGGFWAVSNVGEDGVCNSAVVHLAGLGARDIYGRTTGPCPEPGAYMSLLAGMGGFGLMVRMRRKK